MGSFQPGVDTSLLGSFSPPLIAQENWEDIFHGHQRMELEERLANYVKQQRWFTGKPPKGVEVREVIPMAFETSEPASARRTSARALLLFLHVEYHDADAEEYLLPLAFASGDSQVQIEKESPQFIIVRLKIELKASEGILFEAVASTALCGALFAAIARRRAFEAQHGQLHGIPAIPFRTERIANGNAAVSNAVISTAVRQGDFSNTAIIYGDKYFLKLFRRIEAGINPELEIAQFLTRKGFPYIPALAGALEYRRCNGDTIALGILTRFLPNVKDGWEHTLDTLSRFLERVRTAPLESKPAAVPSVSLLDLAQSEPSEPTVAMVGTYLESARLLGQRAGELHLALASEPEDRDFAPEPFTPFYQRALYQSMRNLAVQNLQFLRSNLSALPEGVQQEAKRVASLEPEILRRLRAVHETPMACKRIRCHGDFHLGQVLYTGKDFIFIDFEGEPAHSLGERRIKRTPLRDIAGMIRSFDYALHAALLKQIESGTLREDQLVGLEPWNVLWLNSVIAVFLKAYLEVVGPADLLPKSREGLAVLLESHVLAKAISELSYELHRKPNSLANPLRRILAIIEPSDRNS
jgi:maltose alpha-D-glucosyltransferase/alpha-amylase